MEMYNCIIMSLQEINVQLGNGRVGSERRKELGSINEEVLKMEKKMKD